jgi:purine-binding chemotaxis protein CheW
MRGPEGERPDQTSDRPRQLVFRIGADHHALDAGRVLEIVRTSPITRVPHGPDVLVGLMNLRGRPVPVLSMAKLLGAAAVAHASHRIVVYDHHGPVGLLVDDVLALSRDQAVPIVSELGARLDRAFKSSRRRTFETVSQPEQRQIAVTSAQRRALLSFRVAGRIYALPLDDVSEVAALPGPIPSESGDDCDAAPRLQTRNGAVPLVELAALLGLDPKPALRRAYAIVVNHGDGATGLVVDAMDVIHRLPEHAIDKVPALLRRAGSEAQIEAIGRVAATDLLIPILSAETLFAADGMIATIGPSAAEQALEPSPRSKEDVETFLIFRLGDERFGLPIGAVDAVIRLPDAITRVPGAPDFVMGLINLRGRAVPLVDQQIRFGTAAHAEAARRRAIIVTLDGLQVGFVVDAASEIKAIPTGLVSAAPAFSTESTDVFDRAADVDGDGHIVLLVDPAELLTRAERDSLSAALEPNAEASDP